MKYLIFCFLILLDLVMADAIALTKLPNKKLYKTISRNTKHKRELVYLFTANGGMVGYFSDGSVVGCPRCDFCKTNILAMFKKKSFKKWDLKKPTDFNSYQEDKGWVLINRKWYEKVPQF